MVVHIIDVQLIHHHLTILLFSYSISYPHFLVRSFMINQYFHHWLFRIQLMFTRIFKLYSPRTIKTVNIFELVLVQNITKIPDQKVINFTFNSSQLSISIIPCQYLHLSWIHQYFLINYINRTLQPIQTLSTPIHPILPTFILIILRFMIVFRIYYQISISKIILYFDITYHLFNQLSSKLI